MRENLPKEMDFVQEKVNAERAVADFENVRTSMYIRKCHFMLDEYSLDAKVQRR